MTDVRDAALDALRIAADADPRNQSTIALNQYAGTLALIYIGDELRAAREARAREIGGGPHHGNDF